MEMFTGSLRMLRKTLKTIETKLNNRIVDFVIGGSYMNDYRTNVFAKMKKMGLEAHTHILAQRERFKQRYRE